MRVDPIRAACGVCRHLFTEDLRPRKTVFAGVVAIFSMFGALIFAAARADHTLRLPPPGRGLLDHYGFHACFASAPLILLTTYVAVAYFLRLMCRIDALVIPDADNEDVAQIITPHIRSLFVRKPWRGTLGFFIYTGTAVSIGIFRQLKHPVGYWGNDVFNAIYYHYGYVAANAFLLITWGLIYPIAFYCAIRITVSMEVTITQLRKQKLLRLDFLNIDRCGGMAGFGALNFIIMLIYLWPLGALYALHLTHRYTYLSLTIGAIIISVVLALQSVYGIYRISRAIAIERAAVVSSLNQRIEHAMSVSNRNSSVILADLAYRDCVLAVESFPYSTRIALAVNVLRFTPALLAVAKGIVRNV